MRPAHILFVFGFALAAFAARAQVPVTHYNLHEMNFDLWCQETKHYPPERCDKRLPQDDKEFQAYVAQIQKYEIPYLEQRHEEQERNQSILHDDPIGDQHKPQPPAGSEGTTPQP